MTDENISPKQAAQAASKFYKDTTGNYGSSLSLEEIELKGDYWFVTLGIPKGGVIYDQKEYKVFKVHAKTGNVESMILRK
jgi:hypothetical protein